MKRIKFLLPILWVTIPFLISCKKSNSDANNLQNQANDKLVEKIQRWLDKKKESFPDNIATIDSLKEGLNFAGLRLEQYKESEVFIVVPISDKFRSRNNGNTNPDNYLVMDFKNQDSIIKGNIIQYTTSNSQKKVIQNTFYKIFTHQNSGLDGKFTILSIADFFQYEIVFKNGRLNSVGEQVKRPSRDSSGRTDDVSCTDWYLVTTTYYDDGSTSTTEEYLFTTCGDECNSTRLVNGRGFRVACGDGGGNTIEYDYALSRPWKWDVGYTSNWWAVSYETVSGERKSSEPQGGHFTNIIHVNSYFQVSVPPYTWQEIGNTTGIDNPQQVYSSTTGKAIKADPGATTYQTVSNSITGSFSQLMGFSGQ